MNSDDFGKAEIDAIEAASKHVENMLKVSFKVKTRRFNILMMVELEMNGH